jgi:putative sterol carrier protein
VARYLSEQWFGEVAAALDGRGGDAPGAAEVRLVLQELVTDTPDGDVAYSLRIEDGRLALRTGDHGDADVTISQDYATAVALHRGEVTLQDAFMHGRVKVAGNISALLAHHDALAHLDPLPAATRATTTY